VKDDNRVQKFSDSNKIPYLERLEKPYNG